MPQVRGVLFRVNGFARTDRHETISRAKQAINESSWVLDFKLFSNTSICINFELPTKNIRKLYASLMETGMRLSEESHAVLARYQEHREQPAGESFGDGGRRNVADNFHPR